MGDRFYMQQGMKPGKQPEPKPKRRLKADIVKDICNVLDVELSGLNKCDVKTLDTLLEAISK